MKKTSFIKIPVAVCLLLTGFSQDNTFLTENLPVNHRIQHTHISGDENNCQTILNRMHTAVKNLKTVKYTLVNTERIKGKLLQGTQVIKLNISPFKCYMYFYSPSKGAQLLYNHGQNGNKALYKPSGFPYMTLSLDPYGETMRDKNHHIVTQAGFEYIADIIRHLHDKYPQCFTFTESAVWKEKKHYKIEMDNPDFKYYFYTVKENENLVNIAGKLRISDYMIRENNPQITTYYDVREGQKIKIPGMYAKKIICYIDKETHLPVFIKIYDDKGLYEQYEHKNINVNITLKNDDFLIKTFKKS